MTYKGTNVRDFVLKRVKSVAEYLVQNRENDTKSLSAVCKILHILVFQRGIDRVSLFCLINHSNRYTWKKVWKFGCVSQFWKDDRFSLLFGFIA